MTDNCSYGRPLTTSAKTSRSHGAKEFAGCCSLSKQTSPLGSIPALSIDELLAPARGLVRNSIAPDLIAGVERSTH